jgi:uncharacterized protein (TIGR03083 family)
MVAPLPADAGFDELFAAWRSASNDFIDLVTPLSQAEWDAPTALPGWSVGDIVAHIGWLEGLLMGEYDAPHEPDWSALPHAQSDFGRITEVPVDLRRSWAREAVLIELADRVARRTVELEEGPHEAAAEVMGPFGPAPLARVLRMRTLDTWVHEQRSSCRALARCGPSSPARSRGRCSTCASPAPASRVARSSPWATTVARASWAMTFSTRRASRR